MLVSIDKSQPNWYSNVNIIVNDIKLYNWHRLYGDDGDIYYGSLESNDIILEENVSYWEYNSELI